MRHRHPLGSKLRHIGHGIGDRIRHACVPITSALKRFSKREQCSIGARSTYELKRNWKSSVIETDRKRDGRKTQDVYETREAAERIERGGREFVRSRIGLEGARYTDCHDRKDYRVRRTENSRGEIMRKSLAYRETCGKRRIVDGEPFR